MSNRPFIGVTGVGNPIEQGEVIDAAMDAGIDDRQQFVMVGFNTSEGAIDTGWGRSSYDLSIASLARAGHNEDSGLTEAFVICDLSNANYMSSMVDRVWGATLCYRRGLQIDGLPWTRFDGRTGVHDYTTELARIKGRASHHKLALGLGYNALRQQPAEVIAWKLGRLPVDYVVIDTSPHDPAHAGPLGDLLEPYITAIQEQYADQGIAITDKTVSADTIESRVGALLTNYQNIGIVGSLGLRTRWADQLDPCKVADFVQAAADITRPGFDNTGDNL